MFLSLILGKGVTHSMKKGFAMVFGLLMVATLAFTGCYKKEEAPPAPPAEAPAPAPEAPAEAPAPEAPAAK